VHSLAGAAYSLAWVATIYQRIAFRAGLDTALEVALDSGGWQLFSGLWLYGVLAGIFHTVRAERQAGEEREAADRANALRDRAEALRTQAELRALRARLNPHFLFNTLHSVGILVRRDPAAAEAAIERLGDLLRYVLNQHDEAPEDARLAEELSFARDYLALEQIRLGPRLRVVEEIDEEALDCLVPTLTLQPLVENAVRHGIAPRPEGGTVRIALRRAGDRVVIRVEDDGRGAAPGAALAPAGLGLRTVRQRLEVRFAGRSRLEVDTAPGAGFSVTLTLPAAPADTPSEVPA
jgi:sensor histidine kinase YesM